MKVYFDESGNTGCVISANDKFTYDTQRLFCLCGVIVRNDRDEELIKEKYNIFKKKYGHIDEIKGNDLLTRSHNKELKYFVDNILDNDHFSICYYDKKFYIATQLMVFLLGHEFRAEFSIDFYEIASAITVENEELLIEYCKLTCAPTIEVFECFLQEVVKMENRQIDKTTNPLIMVAQKIIEKRIYNNFLSDLLCVGSYKNSKYTNVINLNALSELIYIIKTDNLIINNDMKLYHDEIDGFSEIYSDELNEFNIGISFLRSSDDELIQIADNVVSIFFKVFNDMIQIFEDKKEWREESEWILSLASEVFTKIDMNNIKFTVAICDWAIALCVRDMFDEKYLKAERTNMHFNILYIKYLNMIKTEVAGTNHDYSPVIDTMCK